MFRISRSADEVAKTGLSSPRGSSPRPSRIDVLQWRGFSGDFSQSVQGEQVCFVPYLLRGVGFQIHPFLRGLLEYYGLQLHNFTPASILHIAGYVALRELFLGCEAHFELWRKLFCLVKRNHEGSIFQVGSAEVWRIAGTGYLSGMLKKASEEWPSEWFYIDDVALLDPVRKGLPEFTSVPLKKCHSWRPRSLGEEDSTEVRH